MPYQGGYVDFLEGKFFFKKKILEKMGLGRHLLWRGTFFVDTPKPTSCRVGVLLGALGNFKNSGVFVFEPGLARPCGEEARTEE